MKKAINIIEETLATLDDCRVENIRNDEIILTKLDVDSKIDALRNYLVNEAMIAPYWLAEVNTTTEAIRTLMSFTAKQQFVGMECGWGSFTYVDSNGLYDALLDIVKRYYEVFRKEN